jgi:hypothetical protein
MKYPVALDNLLLTNPDLPPLRYDKKDHHSIMKTLIPIDRWIDSLYAFTHGLFTSPLATMIHPNTAANPASPTTFMRSVLTSLVSFFLNKKYRNGNMKTNPILLAHSR